VEPGGKKKKNRGSTYQLKGGIIMPLEKIGAILSGFGRKCTPKLEGTSEKDSIELLRGGGGIGKKTKDPREKGLD